MLFVLIDFFHEFRSGLLSDKVAQTSQKRYKYCYLLKQGRIHDISWGRDENEQYLTCKIISKLQYDIFLYIKLKSNQIVLKV